MVIPACLSEPARADGLEKWPLVSQNLINKWQLKNDQGSHSWVCAVLLICTITSNNVMTWLSNHGVGLSLTRALTHRWVMTLKGNYVGYVVLVKNIPYLSFFSLILLLMGRLWLLMDRRENPSSYWYWHLGISHLRLKGSIWFIHISRTDKNFFSKLILCKLYSSSCFHLLWNLKLERDYSKPLWSLFIAVILWAALDYFIQMAAVILSVPVSLSVSWLYWLPPFFFQVSWVGRRKYLVLKLLPRRENQMRSQHVKEQ